VIQIHCVKQGEMINSMSMAIDAVEDFFGDARQMTQGITNKVTARSMGCAEKKQAAFCEAKMQVIANNA